LFRHRSLVLRFDGKKSGKYQRYVYKYYFFHDAAI
jgi:hypothetical protein